MMFPVIFTVIGAVLLFIFLKFRVDEKRETAVIIKAFVSMCFIGSALSSLSAAAETDKIFGALVTAGLAFGMLGDIWLDFKYICLRDEYTFTLAGFLVFAIGHILYITALAERFCSPFRIYCLLIPLGFSAFGFCVTFFGEKLMKVKYGKYKFTAAAYCAVLVFFVSFSLALIILTDFKVPALIVINIAGLFFLLSDLILNGTYFGEGKNGPFHIITNHVTYYIAQFMIAFSLCLL